MKCLAVLLAAISVCPVGGQESEAVQPSSKTRFVPERLDRGLRWLSAYGQYPQEADAINLPELKAFVGDWFPKGWTRYLKNELIPDRQFVIENLKLILAKEFHASVQPYIKKDYPQFSQCQEDIIFCDTTLQSVVFCLSNQGGGWLDALCFLVTLETPWRSTHSPFPMLLRRDPRWAA